MSFKKVELNLCVIYRYPKSIVQQFIGKFGSYMDKNITTPYAMFIVNFNIQVDNAENLDTPNFQNCLDSFNLVNTAILENMNLITDHI